MNTFQGIQIQKKNKKKQNNFFFGGGGGEMEVSEFL